MRRDFKISRVKEDMVIDLRQRKVQVDIEGEERGEMVRDVKTGR
jgi:hypothetical protein